MSDETTVESTDEELPESPIGDEVTDSGDDTTTEGAEADASESGDKDHDSKLMSRWQREVGRGDKLEDENTELRQQLDDLNNSQPAVQPEATQEWGEEALRFEDRILKRVAEQQSAATERQQVNQVFDTEMSEIKSAYKKTFGKTFSNDDERAMLQYMDRNSVYSPDAAYHKVFSDKIVNAKVAAALKKKNAIVDTEGSSVGASPAKTDGPSSTASMKDKLTAFLK